MKKIVSYFPSILFLMLLIILWEVIVDGFSINPQVLPSPLAIVSAYITNALILIPHITQTLLETVIGLILAVIFGTGIAIVLRLSPLGRKILYPVIIISQTIPIIALAPLFLIWYGFTILPKVIIVTLVCFFPIAIAFADGMEKINPEIIKLLQSMGATRLRILTMAEIPGALPSFFSGLKIAAAYSVTGAMVGEYVGGYQGLGIFMESAAHSYATAEVFVSIVIASLLSIVLFSLVFVLEYFLLPWHRKEKTRLFF